MLSFIIGCRGEETGGRLYRKIKPHQIMNYTDYRKAYDIVLARDKHKQSKSGTYSIGGLSNRIWHYLARFKRKTN